MAYEFKKLSDVEAVTEPAELANVLIEEDGVIKKTPKSLIGSVGGGNCIVLSVPIAGESDANPSDIIEGSSCNKSFDESVEMIRSMALDYAILRGTDGIGFYYKMASSVFLIDANNNPINQSDATVDSVECVCFDFDGNMFFYYRNGLSNIEPGSGPL